MSILLASTANRIGVRRKYKPVTAMGVYRSPSETPPRQGDFTTRALPGLGILPSGSGVPSAILSPVREWMPILQSGANPAVHAFPVYEHTPPVVFNSGSGGSSSSPAVPTTSTPMHIEPATASPAAPQTSTDAYGNVWELSASGWVMVKPGPSSQQSVTPTTAATSPGNTSGVALTSGAASTEQPGTPVPVNWPTSQSYTDSSGYIWTYTPAAGWQVTGIAQGSAAASTTSPSTPAATAAGTTVSVSSGFDISDLTTWLQESTIFSPVPNFFVVAGAGVLALMLMKGKR